MESAKERLLNPPVRGQIWSAIVRIRLLFYLVGIMFVGVTGITFVLACYGDEFQTWTRITMAAFCAIALAWSLFRLWTQLAILGEAGMQAVKSYEEECRAHNGTRFRRILEEDPQEK